MKVIFCALTQFLVFSILVVSFVISFKQRRLDFFLVSDCLEDNIESVKIIASVGTDHSCLSMVQEGDLTGSLIAL